MCLGYFNLQTFDIIIKAIMLKIHTIKMPGSNLIPSVKYNLKYDQYIIITNNAYTANNLHALIIFTLSSTSSHVCTATKAMPIGIIKGM